MRKDYVLTAHALNIVPLTVVATESVYYANVNNTPQFARNVLMKRFEPTLGYVKSSVI